MRRIVGWGVLGAVLVGCSGTPPALGVFLTPGIGISTTFSTVRAHEEERCRSR